MDIFEQINEIANICEAIAEVAGKPFSLAGRRVSPDEWRKFMRERKLVAAEIAKSDKKNEEPTNESEEEPKKHWTQHQASDTNQYYQSKWGSNGMNKYQQGQRKIKQSYNNYKINKTEPAESDMDLAIQINRELAHIKSLAAQGKISKAEIGRAYAKAKKMLPPGALARLKK